MEKGIIIAGNILADIIKMIDVYPSKNMLCNITDIDIGVGGCVPNTLIDLAKLDSSLKLKAIGKVGDDANGKFLLDKMTENGIDVKDVKVDGGICTSFTDVMTENTTKQRTFFHHRGANAELGIEDIDFDNIECSIFHIGYALLLDKFDKEDNTYGTVMARALYNAKQRGFKTSLDVVSEEGERFKKLVSPCIKYCDYVIINETEGEKITGISARDSIGKIIWDNLIKICQRLFELGANETVCIHFPEGGIAMEKSGKYEISPSYKLPKGFIKGTVGAGDAFCAGMLYSFYNGYGLKKALKIASGVAACSLSESDSTSGVKDIAYVLNMEKSFETGKI